MKPFDTLNRCKYCNYNSNISCWQCGKDKEGYVGDNWCTFLEWAFCKYNISITTVIVGGR